MLTIEPHQIWRAVDKRRFVRVVAVAADGWISIQSCDEAGVVAPGTRVRRAAFYSFAASGLRSGADYLPVSP